MLNLPENWDYSLKGLVAINKESYDTIRSILNELKDHNYIEIIKSRNENGTFRYNYLIFTNPSILLFKAGVNSLPNILIMLFLFITSSYISFS